jgi:hypothetical protein
VFSLISAGWTQWIPRQRRTHDFGKDTLTEKGVASVTRVMGDPRKDIGLNILTTFDTLADAVQSVAGE